MKAKRLSNGNLLVPAATTVKGEIVWGLKEVAPGSPEYAEWADYVREEQPAVKLQPVFAAR